MVPEGGKQMKSRLLYLHAITPLHSGIGQSADVVDLPISREKSTGWPNVPGSSFKGNLRDTIARTKGSKIADTIFGSSTERDDTSPGNICITDQRLLLLPVRSFYGVFAWLTCPSALKRYTRDANALGIAREITIPEISNDNDCLVNEKSVLEHDKKVYLEDVDLDASENPAVNQLAAILANDLEIPVDEISSRLAVVHNDVFSFFCKTATEINARIKMGDNGTASGNGGNLWYEEALSAESVLYGFALLADHFRDMEAGEELLNALDCKTLQIGGNASVGRGICKVMVKS
jgi:CRISPR-associated protein Cmr4